MGNKFADPDVDQSVIDDIKGIVDSRGASEPWDILEAAEDNGIEKTQARKALRKLKMSNKIVPAGNFSGEIRLSEE